MTTKQLKDFCLLAGFKSAQNGEPYPNKTAISKEITKGEE